MPFNRFIAWSLITHLIIIIIGGILGTGKKNDFVVFGAHSRYTMPAQYKSSRLVPFTNKRLGKPGSYGKARKGNGKGKQPRKPGKSANHQKKIVHKHPLVKKRPTKAPLRRSKQATITKKSMPGTRNKPNAHKIKSAPKEHIPELSDPSVQKKMSSIQKQKKQKPTPPPPVAEEGEDNDVLYNKEDTASSTAQVKDTPSEPASKAIAENTDDAETTITASENEESDDTSDDNEEGFSIEGIDDPEAIAHYQRYVQEEIDRVWRPPLGVKKGTVCTVAFAVDEKGVVQTCTFIKRSKVLIYDLSIMRVARALRFHASLWNKQFKIDFCQ